MIAIVSGKVLYTMANSLVVDVGGVGLQIHVPAPLLDGIRPGDSAILYTHLVVRQDALTLYGFETSEARDYFTLLLNVNGIGPRLALSVLSVLNPESIRRAVFNEQADVFARVPGVGKKTAQKILLWMQDRLPSVEGLERIGGISEADAEVLAALTALGYSVVEAQAAIQSIPRDAPQDTESRLRLALAYFAR
jgi:Holliday junction DNA helicase RuvA